MNGIIHVCSHPEDENPHFRITEEKIFADIFHYIEVKLLGDAFISLGLSCQLHVKHTIRLSQCISVSSGYCSVLITDSL